MSTTPTYNYNPAPNHNPMDSNREAPRVPGPTNNSYPVPTTPTYILDPVSINYNHPDSPATPIEQPHIEWLKAHQTYRDIKNY